VVEVLSGSNSGVTRRRVNQDDPEEPSAGHLPDRDPARITLANPHLLSAACK
jgi:hypothetical protein